MIGFVSTRTPVKGKFIKEVRGALALCPSGNFNENEKKTLLKIKLSGKDTILYGSEFPNP